jgi:levansucrase
MLLANRSTRLRCVIALLAVTVLTSLAAPAHAQYSPDDEFTAVWTRAQALKISQDPTNTKPRIPPDFPVMTEEVWVWDTWPLTNLSGNVLTYQGWHVIFSLVAPREIPFSDRHWQARIGFFYSRDAKTWTYGGFLFPALTPHGSREWAGSALLFGENEVRAFYTASGRPGGGIDPTDAFQRLATSRGRIHADANGVWFTGFRNHTVIAEPDGRWYQTLAQGAGGVGNPAFRDPWVFRNPADDRVYMLFEGNSGGPAGSHVCGPRAVGPVPPGHEVPADARFYTGNIGLARAQNANMTRWRLLPPLLSANCVDRETERPHLVIRGGPVLPVHHQPHVHLRTRADRPGRPLRLPGELAAQRLQAAQRERPGPGQPPGGPAPAVLGVRHAQPARGELHRHRPDGRRRPLRRHAGTDAEDRTRRLQHLPGGAARLRVHPGYGMSR